MRPTWKGSPRTTARSSADTTPTARVPRGNGVWRVERALAGFRRNGDRAEQAPARSRRLQGKAPVSEAELEEVIHEYRHVHDDHRRTPPQGRARRHLEVRLQQLRRRFERLLGEAPMTEAERARWRDALRARVAVPSSHSEVRPLLFLGRSDSGEELRLTSAPDGTVEAVIEGTTVAVLDDVDELTTTQPGLVFTLDGRQFHETFRASAGSRSHLRESLQTGRRLPRAHVRELLEDGLVDRTLSLTKRGRRALALDVP